MDVVHSAPGLHRVLPGWQPSRIATTKQVVKLHSDVAQKVVSEHRVGQDEVAKQPVAHCGNWSQGSVRPDRTWNLHTKLIARKVCFGHGRLRTCRELDERRAAADRRAVCIPSSRAQKHHVSRRHVLKAGEGVVEATSSR
tara:strand:- start:84 stop:503 length:420 start_codon:yes stop_codon:yes gene_type:complete